MQIMCLNGWGGTLYQPLIAFLAASQPDVLCLQEVVHSPQTSADLLTYRDGDHALAQRPNLFSDVAAALPEHVAIFCPAAQGVLWDGETGIASQWGLATFVNNAFPITAQAQRFVHKTFSPHGYGDHPRSRNAHAIRLYDYGADRFVTIAHMHGLRDLNGKGDTPQRLAQAENLRDLVRSVAEPHDPLVVCGDFNVEPGSQTFGVLAELGLRDLVTGRTLPGTRSSHYKKPGKFADYMLVNEAAVVRNFTVITTPEVSDHCPLLLEI